MDMGIRSVVMLDTVTVTVVVVTTKLPPSSWPTSIVVGKGGIPITVGDGRGLGGRTKIHGGVQKAVLFVYTSGPR